MKATETALIVPVPPADPIVGPFRATLDLAASWGVPAHVTVLYPFLPPHRVDDEVLSAVAEIVGAVSRFDLVLDHVEWFGDEAVWLAPQPDEPFRTLTTAVWRRWPETPPYSGRHSDVTPHLTIGHDQPPYVLKAAAQTVAASLPIHATVDVVSLIAGSQMPASWQTLYEFPLR